MFVNVYMYIHVHVCLSSLIEVAVTKTQLTSPIASICFSAIAICLVCHNVWPEL